MNISTDALLVCQNKNAERVTTRTIQRWIKEVCDQTLLEKKISPHSFRHSKAHRILDRGELIRDVQMILGHESPISSFHYLTLNKKRQLEVSKKYLPN